MKRTLIALAVALGLSGVAIAGPVVIDGTDSNDHGSSNGTANLSGWLYMQKVLENLRTTVTGSAAKVLVNLGADPSTQAGDAIASAFSLSTLPALGWTLTNVNGDANVTTWLSNLSTANTGILYIPTFGNSSGDLDSTELAAVNTAAGSINAFVSGAGNPTQGGALFAMGETGTGAYGWLTTLIPGIVFTDQTSNGVNNPITLTAAGSTAFPGLTSADLSTGPWHGSFSGSLGGLSVLGVANNDAGAPVNVILGGGAGTVIGCGQTGQPACPAPEPGTLPLLGLALAGLAAGLARRRKG